jgi:hypothetical protein
MVLINVPAVTAGGSAQLAANQIISSWTQFTGMAAESWLSFNDLLYFGDYLGTVFQAWTGNLDLVQLDNSGGQAITATVQQAYSYFGGRGNQKQVGMYRPNFITGGGVTYNTSMVYDFAEMALTSPTTTPLPIGAIWGTDLWGSGLWGGGSSVQKTWVQARGMGVAASLKMVTLSTSEVLWVATDYTLVQSRGVL